MAIFKPGMKVKRVRDPRDMPAYCTALPLGAIGTVAGLDEYVRVIPEGMPNDIYGWGCEPDTLEPLTDPLAEKFIASIKALGPLEVERV